MFIKELKSEWEIDRTIVLEEEKLILIRFGIETDINCIE